VTVDPLDAALIVGYFAVVVTFGLLAARGRRGAEGFFLAGRRLGWVVIGLSLFASNISSTTLVGLAGAGYHAGVSISAYEWMAAVVLVFFAIFVVPVYLGARIYTVPEYLERRFNVACRYYFSGLTVLGNVFIDTAGTLFAGALVIRLLFPEIELWQSAIAIALLAGLYTAAGGLAAVVYTDALQAVVLLAGAAVVTVLAIDRAGSWETVVAQTPPGMLSMVRPLDDPTMPWPGMVIGVPILGFYFWCTNQFIVQRVLGARDVRHARWGALLAGLLKLPVLWLMVFPGVAARVLFPDLARPDLVFPTLVTELLPVGVRGIVLAGLLAAIMSSIDSTLNSASTLVTMDFAARLRPGLGERALVRVGRATTLAGMLVSALWVPVVARSTTLFEYLQGALAYLFPPVVAVVLLGLFWRRANGAGALAGLLVGHATSVSVLAISLATDLVRVHFLLLAGVFLAVSAAAVAGVSLATAAPDEAKLRGLAWRTARVPGDLPRERWWQDHRLLAALLLALTAWMVWSYR